MTDDIIQNLYSKYFKNWFLNNYKFLIAILIYILYQGNFIITLFSSLGLSINSLAMNLRIPFLIISDSIYVIVLVLLFMKDIKKGILDLKKNFVQRTLLSLNCWIAGCIIMTISSLIISIILKQSISNNEVLVRKSIEIAPLYMLFTCSVVAPILEEIVFRKALHGLIKSKWLFIILSGLGFGLLHVLGSYTNPLDFLYIIPYGSMGCAFAYLLTKTNNIALPIIIHMIHNTILVLTQIVGG